MSHCVFTTPSKIPFLLHLFPLALFYLPPPPFPSRLIITIWLSGGFPFCFFVFLLDPATLFTQSPNPQPRTPFPSDSYQSVHCLYESLSILFIRFHI